MMKKICALGCVALLSIGGMAQSLLKLEGDKAVELGGISKNGRWAYGANQQTGAYLYDLANGQLSFYKKAYADGVSDNGILVGANGVEAAYCKDNAWHSLPLPQENNIVESEARGVSADGKVIVGDISFTRGSRKPCIWTMQADGNYKVEYLPGIEKDFTNRTPQATDALRCSTSGEMVFGRMIDWSGMFNLPVYWSKETDGKWACHLLGKELIFREGATIPSIPDVNSPDPRKFFSKADSITFQHVMDEWRKNPGTGMNPEWGDLSVYITHPDSIAAYKEAMKEYKVIENEIIAKTVELHEALSGKTFDVYTISSSANGRYISTTCTETVFESGASEAIVFNYPMIYDIHVGQWVLLPVATDCIVQGVTDNGDIFYANPYMEDIRNSMVIPAGTDKGMPLSDWIYEQTSGKLNLNENPDFLFDFDYTNMNGEPIIVEDSLILGNVYPASNGRILLGSFYSPATFEVITYFVDMDNVYTSSMKNNSNHEEATLLYPNPVRDILYLKGEAEQVEVYDLSGRLVYASEKVSGSIPVNGIGNGTYLINVVAAGKITTHKIVVLR